MLLRLPSDSTYVVAYAAAAKVGADHRGGEPPAGPARAGGRGRRGRRRAHVSSTADEVEALRRPERVGPARSTTRIAPVALVFTSGTTGQPKGALFRDRQLAAVTRIDVADAWGDPAADADADAGRAPSSPTSAS